MGREKSGSTRLPYLGHPSLPLYPSLSTHLPVLLLGSIKRETLAVLQRDPEAQKAQAHRGRTRAPWIGT